MLTYALATVAGGCMGGTLASMVCMMLVRPKHQHQWGEATMTYTPPRQGMRSFEVATKDAFERAMHGFTTITQKCQGCGLVHTHNTPGRAEQ